MLLRQQNVCLNVGEEAPDFELLDQDGNTIRLSDYKRECNVVLAMNPGKLIDSCKDHLLFYRENLLEFSALDTQVLGINMDSTAANRQWTNEIGGLGFPLLSDHAPLGNVTLKYDCFVPKEGFGKRALFVIDKEGIIRHIEVLSGEHGSCPNMVQVLDTLQTLK